MILMTSRRKNIIEEVYCPLIDEGYAPIEKIASHIFNTDKVMEKYRGKGWETTSRSSVTDERNHVPYFKIIFIRRPPQVTKK